jgi:hypothetical protein
MITLHEVPGPSGLQFDDQPPVLGDAVSVTVEPFGKYAVHPCPEPLQLIPAGLLTTVPVPAPTRYTLSEGRVDPPPFGSTVMLEVPTIKPDTGSVTLAVMLLIQDCTPQETAVVSPDEFIVAIAGSVAAQVTRSVISTVVGAAV